MNRCSLRGEVNVTLASENADTAAADLRGLLRAWATQWEAGGMRPADVSVSLIEELAP